MSQHDLNIANQGFPAFRADLNDALVALGSTNSGATAPATPYANQLWYDTANNILKIRNEDNDAWISIATLDQSGDVLSVIALNTISEGTSGSGVTVDGVLLKDNAVTASADSTISGLTVGKGGGGLSSNTAIGAGALSATNTVGFNVAVGANAFNANTTGQGGVAIGSGALQSNTTGNNNTATGINALLYNTTGQYSSAYGTASLQSNTTGSNNVACGYGALQNNTTASNSTAVGYQAGYTNVTGEFNTYLGRLAGYTATGSKNIFVGNAAGYDISSGANNTILGSFSGNSGGLDIRTASNYIVLSDGDGNPRLVSDATGNITKPKSSAFCAKLANNTTNVTGDGTLYTIVYDSERFDYNSNYNTSTGVFTAPVTGVYQFNISSYLYILSIGLTVEVTLVTSNNTYQLVAQSGYTGYAQFPVGSITADMDAADTAYVTVKVSGTTKTISLGQANNYFSGFLVG
jgi:hypothetical protein